MKDVIPPIGAEVLQQFLANLVPIALFGLGTVAVDKLTGGKGSRVVAYVLEPVVKKVESLIGLGLRLMMIGVMAWAAIDFFSGGSVTLPSMISQAGETINKVGEVANESVPYAAGAVLLFGMWRGWKKIRG